MCVEKFPVGAAAAICSVMLAMVDWPAEAAKAQELIARAAAEAAADAAAAAEAADEDAAPDLEAAPAVQAAPSRAGPVASPPAMALISKPVAFIHADILQKHLPSGV